MIAKAIGLINTPPLVQAIPYVSGFIALISIAKNVGEYAYKLDTVVLAAKEIKADVHKLDKRVSVL